MSEPKFMGGGVLGINLSKAEIAKILEQEKRMEKECKGCEYRKGGPTARYCDYLCMTGKRRPCPPGKACTVKKKKSRKKMGD